MRIGYARVSTTEQNIEPQLMALSSCEQVYQEKMSGKGVKRLQLEACLSSIRTGDLLVVTRLDRLGRSTLDLINIINDLNVLGVGFECIEQPMFNIEAGGKVKPEQQLMLTMMSAFAEFETDLRRERQADGIEAARAAGKYLGRTSKITDKDLINAMEQTNGNKTHAAKLLGITYQGFQKRFKQLKNQEVQLHMGDF